MTFLSYCKNLFLIITLGLLCACGSQEKTKTPQTTFAIPTPVRVEGSLVSAAIPDLHETLDAVQVLSDRLLPEELQANLKAQIGGIVGDPELKGIVPGNGAAVMWDGELWFALLECTPEFANGFSQLLNSMQMQTLHENGVLLISQSPVGIEKGKTQISAITENLLGQDKKGAVLHIQSAELVEKFRSQLDMFTVMLPNMMASASTGLPESEVAAMKNMARIVEAEMRVLISLAEQLDSMEIHLEPKKDSISFAYLFDAKADTRLHTLLNSKDTVKPDSRITTANLPPSLFEIELFMGNPEALSAFFTGEAEKLINDMAIDHAAAGQWMELMKIWPTFLSGSMAETVDMSAEDGLTMGYLISVTDEKELLNQYAKLPEMMEPFMAYYENIGMPINLGMEMDSRTYKGNAVHTYSFAYDMEKMDPDMFSPLEQMGMADMNSEFTIVDGRLLWSMGNLELNDLVDAVSANKQSGAKLDAKDHHPAGGICYYDLDMGRYFELIRSFMPAETPGIEVFNTLGEGLKGSPPLTGAGYQQDGRALWTLDIPIELVEGFVTLWTTGIEYESTEPMPVAP